MIMTLGGGILLGVWLNPHWLVLKYLQLLVCTYERDTRNYNMTFDEKKRLKMLIRKHGYSLSKASVAFEKWQSEHADKPMPLANGYGSVSMGGATMTRNLSGIYASRP